MRGHKNSGYSHYFSESFEHQKEQNLELQLEVLHLFALFSHEKRIKYNTVYLLRISGIDDCNCDIVQPHIA